MEEKESHLEKETITPEVEKEMVPPTQSPEEVGGKSIRQTILNRRITVLAIFVLFLFLLIGGVVFYIFQASGLQVSPIQLQKIRPTPTPSIEKPTPSPEKQVGPNVSLGTGFAFHLPNEWSAKISNQSKQHFYGRFFIPDVSAETTYVEIESIASSRLTKNPLIVIEKSEQKSVNNLTVTLIEGKEGFQNSNRQIRQAVFTSKGFSLAITLYRKPTDQVISQFDALVQSVSSTEKQVSQGFLFISEVYAAESISGIDKDKYMHIEIMGDPLPERVTRDDIQYKDGYAKFYTFEAFKGQRLTTVAMEDRTTNPGSFIKTELYDEQGELIDERDTRIEYDAPYTGVYYWIVRSFNFQEGGYLLKVFDRNQTDNLIYLKYEDGSERLYDPRKTPPQYGEKEMAIIFQFINPIEVIDDRTVRYYAKPKEFETGLGLITSPLEIYAKRETYEDMLEPGSQLPEWDPENLVNTKITKLSPSKVLIEPKEGGLFPKNHHIVVVEQFIGRYRFFTENPQ